MKQLVAGNANCWAQDATLEKFQNESDKLGPITRLWDGIEMK